MWVAGRGLRLLAGARSPNAGRLLYGHRPLLVRGTRHSCGQSSLLGWRASYGGADLTSKGKTKKKEPTEQGCGPPPSRLSKVRKRQGVPRFPDRCIVDALVPQL